MIYLILALVIVAGVAYFLFQSNRKKSKEISELKTENFGLLTTIEKYHHIIKRMEEVNLETAKKKKTIHTDNDSDNFDNSLDILSERPADSSADKD